MRVQVFPFPTILDDMRQDTVRWLTDPEQRAWRSFLRAFMRVDRALDQQMQRDSGMPHTYYIVLAMLSEAPGRTARMTELAEATHSSQSRLSHAVARLEDKGWIRRHKCPTDKRGSYAVLTDEGFAALVEAAPGHVEAVQRLIFDRLTPDQVTAMTEIFDRINDGDDHGGC